MKTADGTIFFKEWLPDLPALDNPGLLDALNTLPIDGAYKNFEEFGRRQSINAVSAPSVARMYRDPGGSARFYFGTDSALYVGDITGATARSSTAYSSAEWDFARFDNFIFATNYSQLPQVHTLGSSSNFADVTAPRAKQVGVVNRFLVLGNTNETVNSTAPSRIQWSSIDSPTDFPLPGSSTAIARQAGEQFLRAEYGPVTGITNGDQFGLVFQTRGINRMTYVGGDIVFQFDEISAEVGALYPRATVQVGGITYFISGSGFHATDGTSVQNIGHGKVDKWFLERAPTVANSLLFVHGVHDVYRKLVYWFFPDDSTTGSISTQAVIFNYAEQRWSRANASVYAPFSDVSLDFQTSIQVYGFGPSFTLGAFGATASSAVQAQFITGDAEFNRGGKTFVQGIKPLVDATTNAVTVALGYRDDLQAGPTYTSETTANSRSGFADFRNEARYHRARLTITGTFNAAQGLEYQAVPTGAL